MKHSLAILRALRRKTQIELAEALGVSVGIVRNSEEGRGRPSMKALDAVRDYLACSYDDAVALLTGTLDATAVVALHERTAAPDADDRTKGDAA